jgi:thiamine-monophosphate kinase
MQLAISTDMLVANTHFLADTDPEALGWKTLAVNVSDLAAMGAVPRWVVLAVSLPQADEAWVAAFARGFFSCCQAYGLDAVGGDTTRGPLNLCPTVLGEVPLGQAIQRAGAQVGDMIWVSGQPGRAALALDELLNTSASLAGKWASEAVRADCFQALLRPIPRVALGQALRGVASAMLDVSDGLLGDLSHLLAASQVSAQIQLPDSLVRPLQASGAPVARVFQALLAGGDDYELVFTAAPQYHDMLIKLAATLALPLTPIGTIVPHQPNLIHRLTDPNGQPIVLSRLGYDHFSG